MVAEALSNLLSRVPAEPSGSCPRLIPVSVRGREGHARRAGAAFGRTTVPRIHGPECREPYGPDAVPNGVIRVGAGGNRSLIGRCGGIGFGPPPGAPGILASFQRGSGARDVRREPPAELGDTKAEHDPKSAPAGALERDRDTLVVDRADREECRRRKQHDEPEVAAGEQGEEPERGDALTGDHEPLLAGRDREQ